MSDRRLIYENDFEAALCDDAGLSIEALDRVLRILRGCKTVEPCGSYESVKDPSKSLSCQICGSLATKKIILFDDIVDVCDVHFR